MLIQRISECVILSLIVVSFEFLHTTQSANNIHVHVHCTHNIHIIMCVVLCTECMEVWSSVITLLLGSQFDVIQLNISNGTCSHLVSSNFEELYKYFINFHIVGHGKTLWIIPISIHSITEEKSCINHHPRYVKANESQHCTQTVGSYVY